MMSKLSTATAKWQKKFTKLKIPYVASPAVGKALWAKFGESNPTGVA